MASPWDAWDDMPQLVDANMPTHTPRTIPPPLGASMMNGGPVPTPRTAPPTAPQSHWGTPYPQTQYIPPTPHSAPPAGHPALHSPQDPYVAWRQYHNAAAYQQNSAPSPYIPRQLMHPEISFHDPFAGAPMRQPNVMHTPQPEWPPQDPYASAPVRKPNTPHPAHMMPAPQSEWPSHDPYASAPVRKPKAPYPAHTMTMPQSEWPSHDPYASAPVRKPKTPHPANTLPMPQSEWPSHDPYASAPVRKPGSMPTPHPGHMAMPTSQSEWPSHEAYASAPVRKPSTPHPGHKRSRSQPPSQPPSQAMHTHLEWPSKGDLSPLDLQSGMGDLHLYAPPRAPPMDTPSSSLSRSISSSSRIPPGVWPERPPQWRQDFKFKSGFASMFRSRTNTPRSLDGQSPDRPVYAYEC